jgi:hypothetical protein
MFFVGRYQEEDYQKEGDVVCDGNGGIAPVVGA